MIIRFSDKNTSLMASPSSAEYPTTDFLLDAFLALYYDCKTLERPSSHIASFTTKCAEIRKLTLAISLKDRELVSTVEGKRQKQKEFEVLKTFATGSVGRVCLVKSKADSKYYALKTLRKHDLLTRREAAFFMEERESLVLGRHSEWLTRLYASFQDELNLYLLMEYVPGGSLKNLMDTQDEPMEEDSALFYAAEMVLAIEEVHRLGFIHRDIKPDNFLLDKTGHLKLGDFGSSIQIEQAKKISSHETVGTPDYISPEILRAHEGSTFLDETCDWWSLGICIYELLYNEVPFYAETLVETYARIMDYESFLEFPDFKEISSEAMDIVKKLICSKDKRLGGSGANEIKKHSWFKSIDWNQIRQDNPSFIPKLSGPDDTHYFDGEEVETFPPIDKKSKPREFTGKHLPFVGYTFSVESMTQKDIMAVAEKTEPNPSDKILAISSELQEQKAFRFKLEQAIAMLEKEKVSLESENQKLLLSKKIDEHAKEELQSRLARKETEEETQNESLRQLEGKFQEADNSLTKERKETQMLQESLKNLDKENASLQFRLQDTTAQLSKTRDEFQTLQEELFQIRANDDDSVISALRMELSSIEKAKSLLIQENNVLTDKIHSLEMEFVKTRNMHAQELSSTSDAAKELANAKKTISVFKETNSNLQEKVEILEKQLESSNNRVMTLKDCLKTENDTVRKLEAELSTFKGKVFLMENELRNLSAEATQERDAVTTLKEQMTHLESALASEKRAFAEKDKKNSTLSSQIEALQKDKTFLEGKIEIVMNQYESTVSESQAKINVVNKNYKDLQSRYESLSDRATHLEEIKTTMTRLVLELESAIKKETEEKMRLEQLLDEAHHKIESLETHSSFKLPLSPSKRGSLIRKMDSDEVLSRVSDSSDRPSILNLSRTTQKTHRLSFKNFFKSSNAIGDMLRHSLPRLDVDDDSSQTHERSFSIDTCNKSQLSLLDSFDGILRGSLKIPRGGKLRKGWIEKYFTVRDYRLYVFDKEKDSEFLEGTLVADFFASIFLAKAVAPNEVIHVNARDVSSIFKIQASAAIQNLAKPDVEDVKVTEKKPSEIKKKLNKYREELETELKMQEAAEKILLMTKEAQRHTVMTQLEASGKRIQSLRAHVNAYSAALESSPVSEKDMTGEDGDSSTTESIANLKKDFERQLDVEYRKKEAIYRMEASHSNRKNSKTSSSYADDPQAIERNIAKLKENLQILDSNDSKAISKLLHKYESSMTQLGHQFKVKQFYKITDCMVCHEALWGGKNQGLECSVCKEICHKTCMSLVDISCKEVTNLKSVPTMYFMAKDPQDRARWLHALNHFRREIEAQRKSGEPLFSPKPSSSNPKLSNTASTLLD